VTAGAVEAEPDPPPHPASAAVNKKMAAKQHHARNKCWGNRARSTKRSRGLKFKLPYFLSAGETLNTNILIQSCSGRMYQANTRTEVRSIGFSWLTVGTGNPYPNSAAE
jgi:hypothetical protein